MKTQLPPFFLFRLTTSLAMLQVFSSFAQHDAHAQGPLAPPPGPPAPSMKSLDQLEPRTPIASLPFTITAPGSYYLTRNLTLPDGAQGDGITISAENVAIDLCGFTLDGGGTGRHGVTTNTINLAGLQIRNGNVRNWTQRGLDLQYCLSALLDNLQARNNAVGIYVSSASLTRCVATNNSATGIRANFSSLRDCTASVNPVGIDAYYSTLRDSRVGECSDAGITAQSSVVAGCHVSQSRWGIRVNGSSNVYGNTVLFSGSDGIRLDGGGSRIAENNVDGSGVSVPASGIWMPSSGNRVVGNNVTATQRGGGIATTGDFNTIDGNSVLSNGGIGIQVAGTKNTVVRNSALGNILTGSGVTNYLIGTGNNPAPVNAANASTNSWSNTE